MDRPSGADERQDQTVGVGQEEDRIGMRVMLSLTESAIVNTANVQLRSDRPS